MLYLYRFTAASASDTAVLEPLQSDLSKPKLVSKNTARKKYKFTDDDFVGLKFQSFRNPVYKDGPRMQLYYEEDVIARVTQKEAMAEQKELEKAENKRQHREKKKAKWADEAVAAKGIVANFNSLPALQLKTGRSKLSMDLLYQIMDCVVDSYEREGIRGPGQVIGDLVSISRSSKDLYVAANHGFQKFADKLKKIVPFPAIDGLQDPQKLISDPMSVNLRPLKGTLKNFRMSSQGCKEGMSTTGYSFDLIKCRTRCPFARWFQTDWPIQRPNRNCLCT
jgi:hypothetical protein